MKVRAYLATTQFIREIATSTKDVNEACRRIQEKIGQTDGGVAGMFFDDAKVARFENGPDIVRELLLNQYAILEAQFAR